MKCNCASDVPYIDPDTKIVYTDILIDWSGALCECGKLEPGEDCDFVSRFFTPQATILEDPVTGSAHCTLAPYWGARLGKSVMQAQQLAARRGALRCEVKEDHVQVSGQATTYLEGTVHLNQT